MKGADTACDTGGDGEHNGSTINLAISLFRLMSIIPYYAVQEISSTASTPRRKGVAIAKAALITHIKVVRMLGERVGGSGERHAVEYRDSPVLLGQTRAEGSVYVRTSSEIYPAPLTMGESGPRGCCGFNSSPFWNKRSLLGLIPICHSTTGSSLSRR